jgi:hypothetical protein
MLVVVWFFSAPAPVRQYLTFAAILSLVTMIITLPQAIILWEQPDMSEEAS